MACLNPIWIKNKHYQCKPDPFSLRDRASSYGPNSLLVSDFFDEIKSKPYDLARLSFPVPCGRCEECLRAERNSWFVRLDREFAFCRRFGLSSVFWSLTVSPDHYQEAISNPSALIRRFFEAIRHRFGKSIKHFAVQEFGSKNGRIHFHGMFYGFSVPYRDIHELAQKHCGFIWLAPCTPRRNRYVVKYILKDVNDLPPGFQDRKYKRKYVSAGLGNYLGNFPAPSFSVRTWSYLDSRTGVTYKYKIPRYYDQKYLSDEAREKRNIQTAFWMAPFTAPPDFLHFILSFCKEKLPQRSIDFAPRFREQFQIKQNFLDLCQKHLKSHIMSTVIPDMTFLNPLLLQLRLDFSSPPRPGL